jgi:hypothetical protein
MYSDMIATTMVQSHTFSSQTSVSRVTSEKLLFRDYIEINSILKEQKES